MNQKTNDRKPRLTPLQTQLLELASKMPVRLMPAGDFTRTLNTVRGLYEKTGLHYSASGGVINVWPREFHEQIKPSLETAGTQTLFKVAGVEYANVTRSLDGWEIQSVTKGRGGLRPHGYQDKAERNAFYSLQGVAEYTQETKPGISRPFRIVKIGERSGMWSALFLPQIGQRVKVCLNGLGVGTVVAFFTENGGEDKIYLGVEVVCDDRPAWHFKQNGAQHPNPLVFGAELKAVEDEVYTMPAPVGWDKIEEGVTT